MKTSAKIAALAMALLGTPRFTLTALLLKRWVRTVAGHLSTGEWEVGIGWWRGSAKVFRCSRDYYDGWYYGFRIGPFWASCSA